jgi:hypothetical protein
MTPRLSRKPPHDDAVPYAIAIDQAFVKALDVPDRPLVVAAGGKGQGAFGPAGKHRIHIIVEIFPDGRKKRFYRLTIIELQ